MIEEDSAGFVEAFTAAVRPHEARSRPLRWMLLIAFGVAFAAALGSLLNGAFGSGSSGSSGSGSGSSVLPAATGPETVPLGGSSQVPLSTAGGTATATASAKAVSWTGVAGPGCTGSGSSFTTAGFATGNSNDPSDWVLTDSGGYAGSGCTGAYMSMPVSGSASALDPNRYALWTFTVGNGLDTSASCKLETFVPNAASVSLVGGAPAYYYYYGSVYSAASSATALGNYAVNQPTDLGRWVADGASFKVTGGKVSVRMVDAGVEQGSGAAGIVRDAAAQVRLTCTGS